MLTRLPSGRRRSQEDALRVLRHDFPETQFLDANGSAALLDDLRTHRIGGEAVFDALVGACARAHDLPFISATFARWRPIVRSGSGSNSFLVSVRPPDELLHKAVFEDVCRLISRE